MEPKTIFEQLAKGGITFPNRNETIDGLPWNEHPKFRGVFLKHLIGGADTEGKLSCHIVRIDPCCVLQEHVHENQWELHEVIDGDGVLLAYGGKTSYYPGQIAVMPKGTLHEVAAGEGGLVLLAKFFPALL